ncbi:hypothetical protein [Agaribacterium sp. ZY112]|uniref:hypothetical protein n=1 Tax=Agaribacterium sp. ZY112 TaxID=3233574 RepID=UPI0035256EBE
MKTSALNWFSLSVYSSLLAALLFISGCASMSINMHATANQLKHSKNVEQTYLTVSQATCKSHSQVECDLNLGYLALMSGRFDEAITSLESAKQQMKALSATSFVETTVALTINETGRSFEGTPTDKVLLHSMMALAYLMKSDLDGARVEVLQADVAMNALAKKDSSSGQLIFMHFLSGIIYEINDEADNALISYRRAYSLLNKGTTPVPEALQLALLKHTAALGLNNEYDQFKDQFGERVVAEAKLPSKHFYIYFDGVVSQLINNQTTLWWPVDEVYLSVALPKFPNNYYQPTSAKLSWQSQTMQTHVIEDLELRVRDDLNDEMPKLSAAALARAATKYKAVKSAQEQDSMLGAFANVLTIISEQADIRQWAVLPSSMQVARNDLSLESEGGSNDGFVDINIIVNNQPQTVTLNSERYSVVLAADISPYIFHSEF